MERETTHPPIREREICLICHPFHWKKDTGRGHDRYASELLSNLKNEGLGPQVVDSGFIVSVPEAAIKELIFPFRLRAVKTDLYHATHAIGAKSAILSRKRPLVVTIHDTIPLDPPAGYDLRAKYWYKARSLEFAAKKSDAVIVPFQCQKDILVSRLGIPDERIKVIKYGLDHEVFYPEERRDRPIKRILFVGEALRQKGVDTLIRGFSYVVKEMEGIELTIASDGRHIEDLKQLAHTLHLDERTVFLNHVPEEELRGLYNSADLFVFPSRYGFGFPLLEAMACGTPVISGNRFDAPEFVGDAGLLIDPDDPRGLADAILKVLTDGELREELSCRGIENASGYSWKKMAGETMDLYEEVLTSGGA